MENLVQTAMQNVNFAAIMPSLVLACSAMALLLLNAFMKRGATALPCWLSLLALAATAWISIKGWNAAQFGFAGHAALDNYAIFFNLVFVLAAAMTILMSDSYLHREGYPVGEYYPLVLFSTVGAMLMASGTDLMTIFLGLEVLSVSLYVLAGFFRGQLRSNEAGLKYFLLGAFSTGFLLYGMALIYGVTGTTNVADIGVFFSHHRTELSNPLAVGGMLLMATGFLFKIAIAPFHMWTPDVYEGSPTPITAFMSAGPKAAAFAAFMRVFLVGLGTMQDSWVGMLWVLAVLTMVMGNFVAISQTNLKRMLAYSSVAHAGYALVGLVAANEIGISAVLFYMLAYAFMNIGAFAVLVLAGKQGEENLTLQGFAGFGYKRPVLAVLLTICLFSLMGIPPSAGFTGKFYIFAGALNAGYVWLAILGVLNSAVSLYYYLRVMVYMYFREPEEDFSWVQLKPGATLCLVLSVIGVLFLGIVPSGVMALARQALF
ncbi:MAG: NADH-quinone oxidoreductase subunit N [Desulfuromonas sp.]|jgi:NADH-quinone oxidoreductase subunit N|nr:NADH-quinone oxidoreductase subunit N [Desulfuromonas thiophila]MDY0398329.1 NADH-quinone oxidoreductase subunit N [Desulfuromonas thiophila]